MKKKLVKIEACLGLFCQVRLGKMQNRTEHYFSKGWEFKIKGRAQAVCTEDLAIFWLICLTWIASKSFFLTCTIKMIFLY